MASFRTESFTICGKKLLDFFKKMTKTIILKYIQTSNVLKFKSSLPCHRGGECHLVQQF